MPRLLLNDVEEVLENTPEYWEELLGNLDEKAGTRGEVVTAVRFDGVEEPTFRQAVQARVALRDLASIEVETSSRRALVEEALAQGASAADALAAAAGQTSETFRGGDLAAALQQLADLGEGIQTLLTALGTASAALGVNLDRMAWSGQPMSAQLARMLGHLDTMIQAQESHDWLTLADLLEYDVQPSLSDCRHVFEALRTGAAQAETA
jgi:hypothetical protein